MVDVSHEPRWGRISEAGGEDPYLNSVFAAARVKAAQGDDYSKPDKVVTSVKHYAAYGQPEARPRLQHDRHVRAAAARPLPAAVQGGDRRRRRHGHVLVQLDQRRARLRQQATRDRPPQEGVGLRRLHRERLHGGRRAAHLPAEDPRRGPVRPRRRRRRPGRRGGGAERRHRLGDGQPSTSATTASSCSRSGRSRSRGSTTPCAASCASSSAPGCSSSPTSTSARPSRRSCSRTP